MKFDIIVFPSTLFTWSDLTGIAEASSLGNRHLQRLYDDACDVGFSIESSKTNAIITYSMGLIIQDGEGEITGWEYYPIHESINKHPSCRGTKIVVYND